MGNGDSLGCWASPWGERDGEMRCQLGTGRGGGDQGKVPSGDWDKVPPGDGDKVMGTATR